MLDSPVACTKQWGIESWCEETEFAAIVPQSTAPLGCNVLHSQANANLSYTIIFSLASTTMTKL